MATPNAAQDYTPNGSPQAAPWIRIARTGTWTDSKGTPRTFTSADFDTIVRNYDPQQEEAPLVFGHPETDSPAYGWVRALRRDGDILYAQIAHVPAAVREVVQDRHYRYVSMALHPDGKRLRHVGLLGGVPPAIKGLGPVQLGDGSEAVVIQFAAPAFEQPFPGGTRMDPVSTDELQKRIGALEQQVNSLTTANNELKDKLAASDKARADAEQAKTAADDGKAKAEQEFAAYKGEQAKAARTARLERLTTDGKVTPGEHKDILLQVDALSKVPEPVEFSDGGKETLEERFWKQLEGRAPAPFLQPVAPPAGAGPAFSAPTSAAAAAPVDLSRKI